MFLMFQNLLAVWNVLANHNQCWNITVIFKNDRTHHKVTCVRYIWSPSESFFKCSGPRVQVWSSIMNPTAPWNWLKDDRFLLGSKRLFCLQGSFFAVRFSFFSMLACGNYGWISVSGFHVSAMLLHFEALDFLSLKSWNTPTPKPMRLTSRGFTPPAEMKECHPGPGTIFPVESFFRGILLLIFQGRNFVLRSF